MLVAARELLAVRSPLDAELMVSDMLGAWWGRRLRRGDVEEFLGEGLVDYAAKAGTPAALTLLVAVAYLGTARQAAKAEGAALALMESDVARPRWAERVGAVKPQGCYVSRDAYGDQDTVVCTFAYRGVPRTAPAAVEAAAEGAQEPKGDAGPQGPAEDPHALVVIVDYNMRGMARDAWVSSQVDTLLEKAGIEAAGNPMLRFEELEPQQARALLEFAMKATAETLGRRRSTNVVSDSYSAYHAFARARIKALPPGRKRPAPLFSEAPYSRDRRAMLAAEFLASDAAEHLSDPSAASRCADHIIDYGCDQDFNRPLRVSPTKCETFLLDWLPRKVLLDPAEQDAMPHVLLSWVRFAAPRTGLPDEGLRATLDAVYEAMGRFTEAYRDPTTFGLDRSLVRRLLPDGDLSALPRRAFAFPFLDGTRGEVDLSSLRPAEDADRRVLLEIDHAAERDRPDFAEHLAWHEEIATRLWNGDPEQMWEAAQRLLDLGHDRHDVLHVLMEIAERIGDHPDELAAALDDIADIPDEPPPAP
ncbi:hypothetical protein DQ384_32375 [Sphaerisporangium album]|uniref:Uncharacterized protein n=1 Tax=Sphaerisporangium album TaxID=509200 RepID=A0A367F5M7_9ACTN|nr:hypothetical protein [Sphaerisporangium album]RCG25045.1 hypothetical protein DQ384_32375 [Sphaerisporangium album]